MPHLASVTRWCLSVARAGEADGCGGRALSVVSAPPPQLPHPRAFGGCVGTRWAHHRAQCGAGLNGGCCASTSSCAAIFAASTPLRVSAQPRGPPPVRSTNCRTGGPTACPSSVRRWPRVFVHSPARWCASLKGRNPSCAPGKTRGLLCAQRHANRTGWRCASPVAAWTRYADAHQVRLQLGLPRPMACRLGSVRPVR